MTKQYSVRRCSKACLLRCSPAQSFLGAGLHSAAAIELAPLSEPNVIYADQSVQRLLAPVRTAYAERSNMGGGVLRVPVRRMDPPKVSAISRSHPTSGVRCCRKSSRSRRCASRKMRATPRSARSSEFEKQLVDYHGKEDAARSSSIPPNSFFTWCRKTARQCVTASASAVPIHLVGRQADFPPRRSGRRDAAAGNLARRPICRGTWKAARKIRSAPARCIWESSLYRIHGSNEP